MVGDPHGIPDYQKVVAENPNLVVVVVERTDGHDAEQQFIMDTLNNSDLLPTHILDKFTGEPNAVAAPRLDFFTQTKARLRDYSSTFRGIAEDVASASKAHNESDVPAVTASSSTGFASFDD